MEALSRGKFWGPKNKSLVQLQILKDLKKECSTDLKLGSMGMRYRLIGVALHVQEETDYAMLKKKYKVDSAATQGNTAAAEVWLEIQTDKEAARKTHSPLPLPTL